MDDDEDDDLDPESGDEDESEETSSSSDGDTSDDDSSQYESDPDGEGLMETTTSNHGSEALSLRLSETTTTVVAESSRKATAEKTHKVSVISTPRKHPDADRYSDVSVETNTTTSKVSVLSTPRKNPDADRYSDVSAATSISTSNVSSLLTPMKSMDEIQPPQIALETGSEAESHDTHIEERSHEDIEPPQIAQKAGTEALKHAESHHESHEAAAEDEEDRFSQISCGTEVTDASEAPSTSSEPDRFKVPKIPGSKSHKKTKYILSRNDYSLMKNIKDQILNDGRDLLMQEFNETYNTRSGKNVDSATFRLMVRSFKRWEQSSK